MENILIIDDEEDVLLTLGRLLENNGYNVTTLSRPEAAINMVNVLMPDIILLDIKLAELDGRDICMQLKSTTRTKRTKIILISGLVVTKEEYVGYGADDFIEKPISFTVLLKKIKYFLSDKVNANA